MLPKVAEILSKIWDVVKFVKDHQSLSKPAILSEELSKFSTLVKVVEFRQTVPTIVKVAGFRRRCLESAQVVGFSQRLPWFVTGFTFVTVKRP